MRILLFLSLFIPCLCLNSYAAIETPNSLTSILMSKDNKEQKQQKITGLCYERFLKSTIYDHTAAAMIDTLAEYELGGRQELKNFIQILIYRRNLELEKADQLLNLSIAMALQHQEKMFLYQFYLNQAYVQTDLGNPLKAVYCYRLTRKVAEELNNPDLLMITDIGISDIYMNIGLYHQALIYIDQAQVTFKESKITKQSAQQLIYLNKAEIYFKLEQLDSLIHYTKLAIGDQKIAIHPDRDLKRLHYFQLILEAKYALAIPIIKEIIATGDQYYKNQDRWYLSACYYHNGALDSAQISAERLINDPNLGSAIIRLDAYKLLANIAQKKNLTTQANHYLQLALKESEDYTQRLNKIGDLASELRLDRMESGYNARSQLYHKERTILVMAIIAAVLLVIIIFIYYRNVKQKNRFQKLLHQERSKELAFINSHQVRKPLANILGLCSLGEIQPINLIELQQYLNQVYIQAKEIDDKLKEVEKKLNV